VINKLSSNKDDFFIKKNLVKKQDTDKN
jgi:hypothetical protein